MQSDITEQAGLQLLYRWRVQQVPGHPTGKDTIYLGQRDRSDISVPMLKDFYVPFQLTYSM